MARKLGIGVVGAGSIGIRGALDHLCLSDVQDRTFLAAVCDPEPGRAQAAADRYGVRQAYETFDELIADDKVDLVTICSPIGVHYDQGLAAIRAGKHVHFNKTMTTTTTEATSLIDEAAARGVKLVASPGQMLRPVNQEIRKLILGGAIGQISWAATGAAFGAYHEHESVRQGGDVLSNISPAWYWRKPGGGPMYDMTVYGLHALTGILGPAARVTGFSGVAVKQRDFRGKSYPCDADDNTMLLLDFGDDLYAFVHGTFAGMVTQFGSPAFFGAGGTIQGATMNGQPIPYPGREKAEASRIGDTSLLPHVVGPHRDMQEAHVFEDTMQLVDWVLDGTPSIATAEHARHVIEIIEAGYRASDTGETQVLTTAFAPLEV